MSDTAAAMECDEVQEKIIAQDPQGEEEEASEEEPQQENQQDISPQAEEDEGEPQEDDAQVDEEEEHQEPQSTSEPAAAVADEAGEAQEGTTAEQETQLAVCSAKGRRGRKPNVDGDDKEKLAKRPRWGDKAFEEITMADVETIVRKCNTLEKKVEANADAVLQLQELQKEKKGLEKELVDVGSDEVARVKNCIAKQLLAQLHYVFAWNADLKGDGFEIAAFVPNVTPKMLKELGGTVEKPVKKQSCRYFGSAPVPQRLVNPAKYKKTEKPAGTHLVLGQMLTLKYFKTTSELQVLTTYKFGNPEKIEKLRAAGRKAQQKGKAIKGKEGEEGEEGDDDAAEEEADDADVPAKVADVRSQDEQVAVGGQ